MAPLHHHFELSGWNENKVVTVFADDNKKYLKKYWTGAKHMNNGLIGKYVPKEKINEYISLGYIFGTLKNK